MSEHKITLLFITVVIFFSNSSEIFAQYENIVFEHYSIDQGMYETNITSVIQDRTGFLWFGTYTGIEKFDGYNFTSFKNSPLDTNSIDNAFVNTLCEDKEGNIWIGTWHRLDKFNYTTGIFTHYKPNPPGNETKMNKHVLSICEDNEGILWIGTRDGLHKFDKSSGKFINSFQSDNNPGSISSNTVNSIYKDKEGSLWFGTDNGLDKLDSRSETFIHYWNNSNNRPLSDYVVNTIFEDASGIFWLGTQNGVVAFDPKIFTSSRYLNGKANSVSSICEDEFGTLWIGTKENGLYTLDKKTLKTTHYVHNSKEPVSISSNEIGSVFRERSGTIWITTLGGGVNKINRVKMPFKKYSVEGVTQILKGSNDKIWISTSSGWKIFYPKDEKIIPYSFGSDYLVAEDKSGNLWIQKSSGGIYKRDINGVITNYYISPGQEINKRISCFYTDQGNTIWFGTREGGGEVYKIKPNQNRIEKVLQLNYNIKDLYLDDLGILWIATFDLGLICYDPQKNIITKNFSANLINANTVKNHTFLQILSDKTKTLWFATEKGLSKYDRLKDSLTYYNEKSGLPHEIIWSILSDENNNLWMSTFKGISKYDISKNKFYNFDASYGLPENGFTNIIGCKTENGELYFGYPSGIVRFHPDSIKINPFIPPVVITVVKKNDKSIPAEKEINLSYEENFLSFEFVALSFLSPARNQYSYKMEGIDTGWVFSGKRKFASYPNLEPGKYVFRVKGSNNDGVWNEKGTSIAIIISPPWWRTWCSYTIYAFLFVFALLGIRKYEMNRLKLKEKIKMDEAVLKEKEDTEIMKSRFFANISHEFRTPLTLILGPAEKIISDTSDDIKKEANIIKKNSRRLLQLINQLLELSKLESGKLKLETTRGNIVSFVKGVTLSFESLAESKDITLKLLPEKDFIELYFDRDKMIKILTNLLSNALKFTPKEGMITVSVAERNISLRVSSNKKFPFKDGKEISPSDRIDNTKGFVEIKIKDTGIGIPQKEIPKLFDRFYQVDNSFTKEHEGIGIGLALTKELVELHHGRIKVESDVGAWTEFTLEFPLGKDHLKDEEVKGNVILNADEIENKNLFKKTVNQFRQTDSSFPSSAHPKNYAEPNEDKTIILVVEDNYDMREYIKESLDKNYQIEEAVNGEQGVRKAEKIIPDLIISDLMMPKIDGNELTRILKSNEKTSHIPIILLTARSGQENKIEGLETGADDYLTKPFETRELQIRIKNLIAIRKKLQEKFNKLATLPPVKDNKKLSSYDEKFMYKVMEVIEKHISEEDFNTEEFGEEIGMSRMQVHRKLKALTGKSAIQFIRTVKLNKAKKMIQEKSGNISEIAYSLGFGSPAYFTKCFKEEFGYPPSEIAD